MSKPSTLATFLERIRDEIYERVLKGEIIYERDKKTLLNHIDIATDAEEWITLGRTFNLLGIVEQYTGRNDTAIGYYHQALDVYRRIDHKAYAALAHNNIGEVHRLWNKPGMALTFYDKAESILNDAEPETVKYIRAFVVGNRGQALLVLGRTAEAQAAFEESLTLIGDNVRDYFDEYIEVKRGLAECALQMGDIDTATQHTDDAIRLASERLYHFNIALLYFTKAHIAERTTADAEEHYQKALEHLQQQSSPIVLAEELFNEAHYQRRATNMQRARDFARRAYQLFVDNDLTERARLVQDFLDKTG